MSMSNEGNPLVLINIYWYFPDILETFLVTEKFWLTSFPVDIKLRQFFSVSMKL